MKTKKKFKWGKPEPLSELIKRMSLQKIVSLSESVDIEDETAMFFEDGADVPASPDQPLEMQNISLDKKVDHFMIQYERESIPTSAIYQEPNLNPIATPESAYKMSESKRRLSLLESMISEADDDPAGGDAGGDDPTGGDAMDTGDEGGGGEDPNKKPDVKPPTINVQNFARSMARLINNYEALCDPKSTIINRARAYLLKNYDMNMAKEFMIILEGQYDLTPRLSGDDVTQGPPAAGSWSGAGGGGGGGGG